MVAKAKAAAEAKEAAKNEPTLNEKMKEIIDDRKEERD